MSEIILDLLPVQEDFFHDETPTIAFIGGLGSGKTLTCCMKMIWTMARYAHVTPIGAGSFFAFSGDYNQLRSGLLPTLRQCLWDYFIPFDKDFEFEDRLHVDKTMRFPLLGSEISFRSLDNPGNWKSLEITFAFLEEAQHSTQFEFNMILGRRRGTALQRRLAPTMPLQFILAANPPWSRSHYLVDLTHEPDKKTGKPPVKLYQMSTFQNPFLGQEYIDEMLAMYSPEIAQAELYGRFIDVNAGQVYPRWDRKKHYLTNEQALARGLPPLTYSPHEPLSVSMDWNLSPLCGVLFQFRRVSVPGYQSTVMFVYDSLRLESALVADAPKEIAARKDAASVGYQNGICVWGDASGQSGNRQSGISDVVAFRQELVRLGFKCQVNMPPGNPPHIDRASATNRMLENTKGEIGVVVLQSPRNQFLALDIEKLMWRAGSTSAFDYPKPKPGEVLPPSKMMSHLQDAFSYPIAYGYPIADVQSLRPSSSGRFSTVR